MCLELKEMGVLDIESDELRAWMISRYGYEGEFDKVKNKPGVEKDMYENGTWMLIGWMLMLVSCVQTSWGVRVMLEFMRWGRQKK